MTEDEHPGPAADEEAEEPSEDDASSAQPETEAYLQSLGRLASEGFDGEEGIEPMTEDEHAGTAAAEEAEEAEELPEEASCAQPEAETYSESPGRMASDCPDDEVGMEPRTKDEHPGTAAAAEAEEPPTAAAEANDRPSDGVAALPHALFRLPVRRHTDTSKQKLPNRVGPNQAPPEPRPTPYPPPTAKLKFFSCDAGAN